MSITKETVKYVSHLARISLEQREIDTLSRQLDDIVGFIDKLKKLNIDKILPTSHILPINNVLREDVPQQSLPLAKTLENAFDKQGNFFSVPKVIE